jgi:glutaminase
MQGTGEESGAGTGEVVVEEEVKNSETVTITNQTALAAALAKIGFVHTEIE